MATENTVDINIKDDKLKTILSKMRIVQTPIIKSKQKQETASEIQKRNKEGEKSDFLIDRGNYEEIQKVEGGNSEQVFPAQINKLEIDGNSNDKDFNKLIVNNKTENNATENMRRNNKASNKSKTPARTESKIDKKEESNSKETTSMNEIEKEENTTNKTNKELLEETKDTENGKKVLHNSAQKQTQSARENMRKESTEPVQILKTSDKKEENMKQELTPTIQRNMKTQKKRNQSKM